MDEQYAVPQWTWTDQEFDAMSWHDASIHALAALPQTFELGFDIDYLFAWVPPVLPDEDFSFWVAPATLVFANVSDIVLHIQSSSGGIQIDTLQREHRQLIENYQSTWLWTITCHQGTIQFRATSYTQYIRLAPRLSATQLFPVAVREISFDRRRTQEI